MFRKLTTIFLVLFLFSSSSFAQKKQTQKPNIIFILVDDQGYGDVGAFWQNQRIKKDLPFERSPHLDELAAHGAMLTQHYAPAPVCAPSRASLLLGVSQGHSNVRDNQFDKALADNYTIASTLKTLGYNTVAVGKWGLQGDNRFNISKVKWPARPLNRGFSDFLGYMRHSDGHEHYPKEGIYRGKKQVWHNGKNIAKKLDKCYTADLWTAYAKHWIVQHEEGKDKNKPFFMYLAFDTPHAVDELPTQKYPAGGGLHGGIQWIGKSGHFINTASGKPDSYVNPDYANATYDDDNDPATPEVPWPETYKRYATANRRIDYAVGDIVQLLKDLHIDSSTLIVYTSDNGPSIETYLGKWQQEYEHKLPTFFDSYGPFDGIKRDMWEGGIRMPTITRWPGHISKGKVVTQPGIFYDWAPTFVDIAGGTAPERMDGVSLLPSLTGKGHQHNPLVYVEYYHHGRTPGFTDFAPAHRNRRRNQMQVIRVGDYVGVRYDIQSAKDDFEIYNVIKDPQQTNNLALHPSKKVRIKTKDFFTTHTFHTIAELQKYMKGRVLQVRRPNVSPLFTKRGTSHRPYDSTLIPAVQAQVKQGVNWAFFGGNFPWIPQVATLQADQSGVTSRPTLYITHPDEKGLLFFYGYLRIPKDGKYTFYLTSDTKSFLRIHDAQVIDEDFGYKEGKEKKASMYLKAGLHPFRLYYYQEDSRPLMNMEWSGPGMSKRQINGSVFYRPTQYYSNHE